MGKRSRRQHRSRVISTGPRAEDDPDVIREIRRALRSGEPLDVLALASMLLAVVDPREDLLEPLRGPRPGPSRDTLLQSMFEIELPETSAILAAIAVLLPDDLLHARIRRELARRRHALPGWLVRLDEAEVYRVNELTHVLADGENLSLAVRVPGAAEFSLVIYVDHNLGTVVKDAFAAPEELGSVLAVYEDKLDDPDAIMRDVEPADARARIAEAIETGAHSFPPFETDTWPACRPLVEWAIRLLPEGGTGYEMPDWTKADEKALATRFFASDFGRGFDDTEHHELLRTFIWLGTDYGPGDPMRWSSVAVEILLLDRLPRKLVADEEHFALAPDLLRAFVRFCHAERGIRADLTAEALAAIDAHEDEYLDLIGSRPSAEETALLELLLGTGRPRDDGEIMLASLRRAVGGQEALDALDDEPLPDEDFCWGGIPVDIRDAVGEVLALCDGCCDTMLDLEYRTACRRFLALASAGDPRIFRRNGRSDTAAAAICWVIGKANHLFTQSSRNPFYVKDMAAHFGLVQSSFSQRADTLLKAAGFENAHHFSEVRLGTPDLLVSARRRKILESRERYT